MTDRAELIARLQDQAGRARDEDLPMDANQIIEATDMLKQDGKRIQELEEKLAAQEQREANDYMILFKQYDSEHAQNLILINKLAEAEFRALAAAEAMKETAARIADEKGKAWGSSSFFTIARSIRALSCADVIGSVK